MLIGEALELKEKDVVVAVGGGGKTTVINKLCSEMLEVGKRVAVTTTTKILMPESCDAKNVVFSELTGDWRNVATGVINSFRCAIVGKSIDGEGKITGLTAQEVNILHNINEVDLLLVEGDGARGKPFKAPRSYEPVIPEIATVIIVVVGVECIGKPLVDNYFHAVEQIKLLTGLARGDTVTKEVIAGIMLHPQGYRKNIPRYARWIPFINKVENAEDERLARSLARILKEKGAERVLWGAAAGNSPVKGIV